MSKQRALELLEQVKLLIDTFDDSQLDSLIDSLEQTIYSADTTESIIYDDLCKELMIKGWIYKQYEDQLAQHNLRLAS